MNDLNVALVLSLKDKLLSPFQRTVRDAEREFDKLEKKAKEADKATANVASTMAKVGQAAPALGQAAQALGQVERGAQQAERNLSLLERTAARLRNTLHGLNSLQGSGGALKGGFNVATSGIAGLKAFEMVAADPLRQAADYDTQLRMLANTAYAGKPISERRAGLGTLNASIVGAVRQGGGTRDSALATLQQMISSGMSLSEANDMLPLMMKDATGSGANPEQLAMIAVRASQNMGIKGKDEMSLLLDKATVAGQLGSFELKDMSKHLPSQMAIAGGLGLRGQEGAARLFAANQIAAMAAGTNDEAANNLQNLLGKVNSIDTKNNFKEIGIDLDGTLQRAAGKGVNGYDAFIALIESLVADDKRFQAAKAAAKNATGSERTAAYQMQADLMQGSIIGRLVPDRQAQLQLIAEINNKDKTKQLMNAQGDARGTLDTNASFVKEGAGFSYDQRNFEVQKAQTDALTQANSAITKLADAQTDLYRRHPEFAQALEGSKVMLESFTAALAAFGAMNLLRGGAGGAAGAAGAAGMGGAARLAGQAAGLYAAWEVGQAAGGLISDKIEGTSVGDAVGSAVTHVAALFSSEARESIAAMERYDKARSDEAQALMQRMEAMSARPVELTLNGDKVAEHVGQTFADLSKRQ